MIDFPSSKSCSNFKIVYFLAIRTISTTTQIRYIFNFKKVDSKSNRNIYLCVRCVSHVHITSIFQQPQPSNTDVTTILLKADV